MDKNHPNQPIEWVEPFDLTSPPPPRPFGSMGCSRARRDIALVQAGLSSLPAGAGFPDCGCCAGGPAGMGRSVRGDTAGRDPLSAVLRRARPAPLRPV
jgi:hypothetical protein